MPGHASNADRIERAASEAAAAVKELDAQKAAKAKAKAKGPKKPRASSLKAPTRVKIVWAVGRPGVASTKSFPYKERAAADAEAARLGKGCMVTPLKVPME